MSCFDNKKQIIKLGDSVEVLADGYRTVKKGERFKVWKIDINLLYAFPFKHVYCGDVKIIKRNKYEKKTTTRDSSN